MTFQPELTMLLARSPSQREGAQRVSDVDTHIVTFVTLKENELCDNLTPLCLFIFSRVQRSVLGRTASVPMFCQIDRLCGGPHLIG